MSVLWVLPLVVFTIGMLVVARGAREASRAARELADEVARLEALQLALRGLQSDADATVAAIEPIRWGSVRRRLGQ